MNTPKKPTARTIEGKAIETSTETTVSTAGKGADLLKPVVDLQEKLRANAEKGIEQIKSQYAQFKGNAENATAKLEESAAAAQAGSRELGLKVLELARLQANAGFDHIQALIGVKNLADALKLQQDFVTAQIEALQVHARQFTDLTRKVATDVAEPVKGAMVVPFKR